MNEGRKTQPPQPLVMGRYDALIGRLESYMGKADIREVLADCRAAAAALRSVEPVIVSENYALSDAAIKKAKGEVRCTRVGSVGTLPNFNGRKEMNMNDKKLIKVMREALWECENYFDQKADADHDQDGPVPNEEMRMLVVVRNALLSVTE